MASRWWFYPLLVLFSIVTVFVGVAALTLILLYSNLPSLEALTDYRPKLPLRVFSAEGELLGEFGEEKRAMVRIEDVPAVLKNAILAAEDERFYQHRGLDYVGIARAALANLRAGARREGASTITQQVARTFFLTNERTYTRKLAEALLAFKIEKNLTKDQIFEIYVNHIYLGQRAYGFSSAASIYYGKTLGALSPAEAAMLAGLPKAPSRFNPVVNQERATQRQHYVLRRMRELGYLPEADFQAALKQPLRLQAASEYFSAKAEYVAEMARAQLFEQYGEAAYTSGLAVYTTVRKGDQDAANVALRRGVIEYDRRHGFRGAEAFVELPADAQQADEAAEEALYGRDVLGDLVPAVVLEASTSAVTVVSKGGEKITLSGEAIRFAAKSITDKNSANRIRRGAVVRLARDEKGNYTLTQLPQVEAALVSLDPKTGAIIALAGGFDFSANKFNHVTQALRQPGSSFKPFIYSAALEKGFTAATIVNDAPIVIEAIKTGSGEDWEPKNYDGVYSGPIPLRQALAKSKNMVSIRVLQAITPKFAQDYASRFGFDPKLHPAVLSMALGVGSATPLQMASAYGAFANGGYRVKPYFISRVVDQKGDILFEAQPEVAGQSAERIIDARNAFLMNSLMRDVISYGTATRALTLGRRDLAGKTGTTNDHFDAWFAGFNPDLVAVSWIGFDNPTNLGNEETGGRAALPIWIHYMSRALKGKPERQMVQPPGIVVATVNPETGARELDGKGKPEYFYQESLPAFADRGSDLTKPPEEVRNQIF